MSIVLPILALFLMQPGARDPFLTRLAGEWSGEGMVLQARAEVRLTWAWALDGQFMQLAFVNAMPKRRFEGQAFYRALGAGRYRGWWFDSSGMMRPIEAALAGDALVAAWGTPETEVGETTYRLTGSGSMEIIDRVRGKDGQWREFGRTRLQRVK
jgi:hypothetical protein